VTEKPKEIKSPLISVIVPVYNTADYLDQCVESICNQTYRDLEIILVDDGSTDRSGEMCDDYARGDERIKVIHKENGGLSSARNAGLEAASGRYIGFVDSDDHILPEMYEAMVGKALSYGADIVQCAYHRESRDRRIASSLNGEDIIVSGDNVLYKYYSTETMRRRLHDVAYHDEYPRRFITPFVWDKLYNADTVGQIRFIDGVSMEDVPFNTEIFSGGVKLVLSTESYYVYRIHPHSLSHVMNLDKMRIRAKDSETINHVVLQMIPQFRRYVLITYTMGNAIIIYKVISYCEVNEPAKQLIDMLRNRLKAAKASDFYRTIGFAYRALIWCEVVLPLPVLTVALRCTKLAVRFADKYIRKIE
jgi:glycosyltransferase involved in cell wall biosynthesis